MHRFIVSAAVGLALVGCGGSKDDTTTTDDVAIIETGFDSAITADNDDTFDLATDVSDIDLLVIDVTQQDWNFQVIGEGIIAPAGDRDFYSLELEAGVTYSIGALSYAFDFQVVLDTVLRIYDDEQNLVTQNDDMPFRYLETDSAVYFTPQETGTYYVEILEYSDWSNNPPLKGGANYEYAIVAAIMPNTEIADNDTLAAVRLGDPPPPADSADSGDTASTSVDTDVDTDIVDYETDDYYVPNYYSALANGFAFDFVGNIASMGDVDFWPYQLLLTEPADGYAFVTFTAWPTAYEGRKPRLTVYDAAGQVLAVSDDLTEDIFRTNLRFDDPGVMVRVRHGEVVYLAFEDADGGFGPAVTYPMMSSAFTNELAELEDEDAGNDAIDAFNFVPFTQSTTRAGLYFGSLWGELPPSSDEADWYRVAGADVGGLDGKYLSIDVQAIEIGSQLDPKINLYAPDGTLLETISIDDNPGGFGDMESYPDPVVRDYQVVGYSDIYIEVTYDSRGTDERAHQYELTAIVDSAPIFN